MFQFQPREFQSREDGPAPHLIIINHEDTGLDGFLTMKSMKKPIKLTSNNCRDLVTMTLYAYYSWDKTYPKVYNLFGFLQEHVLQDKHEFHESACYMRTCKAILG